MLGQVTPSANRKAIDLKEMTDDWKKKLMEASGFSDGELEAAAKENEADKQRSAEATKPAKKGKLAIFVEKKGRGGKTATIITGFTCEQQELLDLASRLKNALGCGGSARDGEILVQGERREDVARFLRGQGYKI